MSVGAFPSAKIHCLAKKKSPYTAVQSQSLDSKLTVVQLNIRMCDLFFLGGNFFFGQAVYKQKL